MKGFEREDVEPILRTLGNDYKIEKSEDGKETIIAVRKRGEYCC